MQSLYNAIHKVIHFVHMSSQKVFKTLVVVMEWCASPHVSFRRENWGKDATQGGDVQ
jgi:hypothetical protein